MSEPIEKPKLAPRVEALEAELKQHREYIAHLAKGMKRAEKIAEDYHGEALMESCEIAGVAFSGAEIDDDE